MGSYNYPSHKLFKSMKKFTFMAAIAVVLTVINGCQKDETITKNGLPQFVPSKYEPEFGKFQKELLVFDAAKENSVLIVCHSESEEILNQYLNNTDLELIVDNSVQNLNTKSAGISKQDSPNSYESPQNLNESIVTIEVITYNLKPDIKEYRLSVKSKINRLKSTYTPALAYAVEYTSSLHADFMGIALYGTWTEGYGYSVTLEKHDCMLCDWDAVGGGILYENDPEAWMYLDYRGYSDLPRRLGIKVIPDIHNWWEYSYNIAYSVNSFYSKNCSIGSYDTRNCYVGAAPTGTNAFINYNPVNGDVYFYYTPLPGNVCPVGLGFDGANCAYLKVPSNCEPFIIENTWYVKPERILD